MTDDRRTASGVDEVLAPEFVADVEALAAPELRRRRDQAEAEEARVSYARRLLQGRIDLLRAETLEREQGTETAAILTKLPDVLADRGERSTAPAHVRLPRHLVPPELPDDPLTDTVADLGDLTLAELSDLGERYAAHEAELSMLRRRLFEVIDRLQSEIVARYRSGEASVTELLADS